MTTVTSGPTLEVENALTAEDVFNPTQGFNERAAQTNFMLTMTHGRKLNNNARYEQILKGHEKFMAVLNRYGFSKF